MRPWRFGYLTAAILTAGGAASLSPVESRAVVALGLTTTAAMIASAVCRAPRRETIAAVATAMLVILGWRRAIDPTAVVGPVPSSLEPVALAVLGGLNLAAAGVVAWAFSPEGRAYRHRWIVFGATTAALVAGCGMLAMRAARSNSPQGILRRVVMLEQSADRADWAERQELSTALAILGRQREAREIATRPDAVGGELIDPPAAADPNPPLDATPWREAVARIAAEHRLVLMMEAHNVTEHRAWIEQTLGPLREAGFTHYRAEAIAESGATLHSRGYPTFGTGVYTLDPRFGNLLRTAIRLGFDVDGYDAAIGDFNRREEHQAIALAARFTSRPDVRMVVHAGHGHVFKHEMRNVGRYMAARLWRATGVEPYTIWQLSNESPNGVYRDLIRRLGPIAEPVLLAPPPREVSQALFPESSAHPAVDALVVHPPRIGGEPMDRRGAFGDQAVRVAGVWRGDRWPVVIAAVADGESEDAVALDQIMLRPGETDFELWLPPGGRTVRVWGLDGPLDAGLVSLLDENRLPLWRGKTDREAVR